MPAQAKLIIVNPNYLTSPSPLERQEKSWHGPRIKQNKRRLKPIHDGSTVQCVVWYELRACVCIQNGGVPRPRPTQLFRMDVTTTTPLQHRMDVPCIGFSSEKKDRCRSRRRTCRICTRSLYVHRFVNAFALELPAAPGKQVARQVTSRHRRHAWARGIYMALA
jgi:hypothetical protein